MKNNKVLGRRFLALLIDFVLVILWGVLLFLVSSIVYLQVLNGAPVFDELGMNLISLTMIVPVVLYSIIMESTKKNGTVGKRIERLKVSSARNDILSFKQIVIRNVVKYFPWQFGHMIIFRGIALKWEISVFWMFMLIVANLLPIIWIMVVVIRKDHRGIHDLIAGTRVSDSNI